jgi:ABC-type multidrug transport system fused ATPase/permease subunit
MDKIKLQNTEDKRKHLFSNCVYATKAIFKYSPAVSTVYTITCLGAGVFAPVSIYCLQRLVDSVTAYVTDGADIGQTAMWGIFYILALSAVPIFWTIQPKMGRYMNRSLRNTLPPAVIKKLTDIEYHNFEEQKFIDTLSRVGNRPQQYIIYSTYLDILLLIQQLIQLFGILGLFFTASLWVGIGAALIGIPIVILNSYSAEKSSRISRDVTPDQRKAEYLQNLFADKHSAYEIKIFRAKNYILDLWYKTHKKLNIWYKETVKTNLQVSATVSLLKISYTAFVAFTLTLGFISENVGFGTLVSVIGALGTLFGAISGSAEYYSDLVKRAYDVNFFKELMSCEERAKNNDAGIPEDADIVFDKVSFTYPGTEREILHDISFTIKCREKAAVVGVNGAGKSTIIKLLCGLYKPDGGHIYIGGKDINMLSQDDIHRTVSVVFQDYGCYQMTLRENIAFGDLSSLNDDKRLSEALRRAGADDVLEKGLDIPLGRLYEGGIDISGGQWQKIAVARAFLSKSHFIILDEPTASLDPIAESRMYSTFAEILSERGTIIISHRLASAKPADKIIVIEGGEVAATGSHSELMKEGGLYAVMFEQQSSWYRDDYNPKKQSDESNESDKTKEQKEEVSA